MDIKKAIAGLVLLGVVGVGALVGAVAMQPGHLHVERSITIEASAADLAPYAEDLKLVNEWSPWVGKDPEMKQDYSENTAGVDAWYTWDGNDEVGQGKQTITSVEPGKVVQRIDFIRPFEGSCTATLAYEETGDGLAVTWAYDQEADFPTKAFSLVMSMEDMLGPDYEAGLASLKPLVEAAAAKRVEEEEAAAAAAEAEAARAEAPSDDKKDKKRRRKK